jgi:hypothetical protein
MLRQQSSRVPLVTSATFPPHAFVVVANFRERLSVGIVSAMAIFQQLMRDVEELTGDRWHRVCAAGLG